MANSKQTLITSTKNPAIQKIIRLRAKPSIRRTEQVLLIEGVRLTTEALNAGALFRQCFYVMELLDRYSELLYNLESNNYLITPVSANVMKTMSNTKSPSGILSVIEEPIIESPDRLEFVLILDQVRDPGNLGTILRTAWAAAVDEVWITKGSVDPFNDKVVRAGMGAHFHFPIRVYDWEQIQDLSDTQGIRSYIGSAVSGGSYRDTEYTRPAAIIIGGEAFGESEDARQFAQVDVSIPMAEGIESLNAATAAGIILMDAFAKIKQKPRN